MAYFYKGLPFLILGAIVVLSAPWLALIALMVAALVVLPALAFAILSVPYMLCRTINRRWQPARSANPPPTPVLSPTQTTQRLAQLRREHFEQRGRDDALQRASGPEPRSRRPELRSRAALNGAQTGARAQKSLQIGMIM